MPKNAYIHIPFCKQKCKYCSFVSYTNFGLKDSYITSLIKEIKNNYNGEKLETIYFGGGTPSLLDVNSVNLILSNFNFDSETEVTFELNPDDAESAYLKDLKNIGINRLSMGSQTFDDNILRYIGRRHDSEGIYKAVKNAKDAGFENISLDLIYGLPMQNLEIMKKDLEKIIGLNVRHISTYGLKIDESSYFYSNPPKDLPDDDFQADMYIFINDYLEKYGYNRYEISNFSKKGYESKHNLNYWNNSEYYGFGAAAHGYISGIRYSNPKGLSDYIKNPLKKETEHKLSEQEKLEEEIFLGFRKTEGIVVSKIKNEFNFDFEKEYQYVINKYFPKYMEKTLSGYRLTLEGVLLSNIILAEFV